IPILQDLTGTQDANGRSIPDELILNRLGNLLFRRGIAGAAGPFAPPVTINPDAPARDFAVFQTATGWAVAAVDQAGDSVSIYSWNSAKGAFERTGGFATGNLPGDIAAADLSGDGRLDSLVVANTFDDTVTIAFPKDDGTFATLTRPV